MPALRTKLAASSASASAAPHLDDVFGSSRPLRMARTSTEDRAPRAAIRQRCGSSVVYSATAPTPCNTYRNIDEDIPLGLAINAEEAVESSKKIRRILRGGKLIPGHEPRILARPEDFGFRRVSAHAIAVVE